MKNYKPYHIVLWLCMLPFLQASTIISHAPKKNSIASVRQLPKKPIPESFFKKQKERHREKKNIHIKNIHIKKNYFQKN